MPKKIAVVGAGWYGSHLALTLSQEGHSVTLIEQNDDIFSGVSGRFGIRLHKGPHYPRSKATRVACQRGFDLFNSTYPELVNAHEYSIYGLGTVDADGFPSKVTTDIFKSVCEELSDCREIDPEKSGYSNLLMAMNFDEPSIKLGVNLREFFRKKLETANIEIKCDYKVVNISLMQDGEKEILRNTGAKETYDLVINATAYKSLLPSKKQLPFGMNIRYQPCLALVYEDKRPTEKPISFIVMDGWFPCLMPYDDGESESGCINRYIVTHGRWTIVGSFDSPDEANSKMATIDDEYIEKIRPLCEHEMLRFWPEFEGRFEYKGWKGAVIPKIMCEKEFRSAVTFQDPIGTIHVIPGKVSNIFDASKEVVALLNNDNILEVDGYKYVSQGVLDASEPEIIEKPTEIYRNTCGLQTSYELEQVGHRSASPALLPTSSSSYCSFWQAHETIKLTVSKSDTILLSDPAGSFDYPKM
jgi:hypothetical protein